MDNTNPLPGFLQMSLGAIARHILTGVAGGLALNAGLTGNQQTQLVSGGAAVVVWLAGVFWSIAQKKSVSTAASGSAPAETLPPL